jgi:hypothetical protein
MSSEHLLEELQQSLGPAVQPEHVAVTIRNLEECACCTYLTTNTLLHLSIHVTEKILTRESREE